MNTDRPQFPVPRRLLAVSLLFALVSNLAGCSLWAGNQTSWFVSVQGSDSNNCHYLLLPCRHISSVIQRAQAGDTILIGSGTFSERLTVTKSLTLVGQGAGSTFVDAQAAGPALLVAGDGASASGSNGELILRVSKLTFQNGDAASVPSQHLPGAGGGVVIGSGSVSLTDVTVQANHALNCGGIFNQSVLTLNRAEVLNNSAFSTSVTGGGGGICNWGTMTITDSLVNDNQTLTNGGGIYNVQTLNLVRSTIADNQAGMAGGGLLSANGILSVLDTTVSGNQALLGGGAALDNNVQAKLERDTLSGNHAQTEGGAIVNMHGASLSLTNVTLSGNTASSGGGIASGNFDEPASAFSPKDPSLAALQVTIAFNTASSSVGGGVYHTAGPARFINTLFASNTGPSCSGTVTGSGNLTPDATCQFDGLKNQTNVTNAMIGPLQDNGGGLQTHALLPGSLAIDAGVVTGATIPTEDERGKPRPDSDENGVDLVDIGAYESDGSEGSFLTGTPPAQTPPQMTSTPTPSAATLPPLATFTPTSAAPSNFALTQSTPATSATTFVISTQSSPATSIPTFSLPTSISCLLYTSKSACEADPACTWGGLIPLCSNK